MITFTFFGVQVGWSLILANATPFLVSLDLSNSKTSFILLGGPLAGLMIHPLVGKLIDKNSDLAAPLILIGWVLSTISILQFYSRNLILIILAMFGLDIGLNLIQSSARVIIFLSPPQTHRLKIAQASVFLSIGSCIGYLLGSIQLLDLPILNSLGKTQFQILCSLVIIILTASVMIPVLIYHFTAANDIEPILLAATSTDLGPNLTFPTLNNTQMTIFAATTLSWFGWFVFLFFSSSFITELKFSILDASSLLFAFSISSLCSSLCIPILSTSFKISHVNLWIFGQLGFALSLFSTFMITSFRSCVLLFSMVGISFAITLNAPYCLLSESINNSEFETVFESEDDLAVAKFLEEKQGGAILGLMNVCVVVPQFLAIGCCSIVFRLFEVMEWNGVFGWCLRIAGVSGGIAIVPLLLIGSCSTYGFYKRR